MRLAVRLDDIAPVMHWENFERMIRLLDAVQAKPLLGVIPECRDEKILHADGVTGVTDEEFRERLQTLRRDGARIAMHGVYHVYTTEEGGIFPLNRKSEFAGLPEEEQKKLLETGAERMKEMGLETDIFMAPSHSYDAGTLKALTACGFKRVTDGFGYRPYRFHELTFYPIAIAKKRAAVSKKPGTVTIVYHVNTMTDNEFKAAEALFDKAEMISWSTLLYEPTSRRSDLEQRAERLLAQGKRFLSGKRRK
ncbi:MAG: DUF2334 domain-containing protein [Lachnospiraceae bacterium]|nr:DUF2334 domain-containing protein [Lachnospiraceae bacterium]